MKSTTTAAFRLFSALLVIALLSTGTCANTDAEDTYDPHEDPHHFEHLREQHDYPHMRHGPRSPGEHPEQDKDCTMEFGAVMGEFEGVPAYSNCNDHFTAHDYYVIDHTGKELLHETSGDVGEDGHVATTGMKWQCVEYARRYLYLKHGLIFSDIPSAEDIWSFRFLHHPLVHDDKRTHLERNFNGKSRFRPKKGDMLIWAKHEGDYATEQDPMPHGHVAIVTDATDTYVRIAEQNYKSESWEGRNYARELKMTHSNNGFKIEDPDGYNILGWMHVDFEQEPHEDFIHYDGYEKPHSEISHEDINVHQEF